VAARITTLQEKLYELAPPFHQTFLQNNEPGIIQFSNVYMNEEKATWL